MIFFKSKKQREIENLLASSKQDFGFDTESVKARLLMAVNSRHLSKEEAKRLVFRPSIWPRYAFSFSLAIILMVSTSTLAFASNRATPGDILFPVQKLQNQMVLSLPLPETKKEEIRTEIVVKRLKELDAIKNNPKTSNAKVQAAVEESQKSIDDAVSHLPEIKPDPTDDKASDKRSTKRVNRKEQLKNIVSKLDDLSKQHEEQMVQIKLRVEDKKLLEKIDESVTSSKANRSKLLKIIKNSETEDDNHDSSENHKNTSD